jgi:mono/diheme cytochrome c family protein
MKLKLKEFLARLLVLGLPLVLAGCQQKMADQPRYEPLQKSEFFGDDRSARPAVEGAVARGALQNDELFYTGKVGGKEADVFPYPVNQAMFRRGQERFNIYCSPCHDRTGRGEGLVVRRGYRPPPSLHIDRLRQAPVGHFFDVMTRGLGAMPDYAEQVPPDDRWAIAAYIRALQFSQQARLSELPESERRRLAETKR